MFHILSGYFFKLFWQLIMVLTLWHHWWNPLDQLIVKVTELIGPLIRRFGLFGFQISLWHSGEFHFTHSSCLIMTFFLSCTKKSPTFTSVNFLAVVARDLTYTPDCVINVCFIFWVKKKFSEPQVRFTYQNTVRAMKICWSFTISPWIYM